MDQNLLEYFIQESNKKHDELKAEITKVYGQLEDLKKFKVEMVVTARHVSIWVSGVLGLVTMIASAVVTVFVTRVMAGH